MVVNYFSQYKNIALSDEFFEQLSKKDWSNTEELAKMGFEKIDDYYVIHFDTKNALCTITVEKKDEIPSNMKSHKNIRYEANEERPGIFSPKRLFTKDIYVLRRCYFYTNGIEMKILEDNKENRGLVFEKFILSNFN
jgi:hypothetical protein